jgi:ribose transport system substrate-binding protein
MKTSKFYILIAILTIMGLLVAGCTTPSEPTTVSDSAEEEMAEETEAVVEETEEPAEEEEMAEEGLTIGLVTKALNNPFWELMQQGALEVAAEYGAEIVYLAPTKAYNLEEQTRLVDDLITAEVDGIVLVPVDSEGMVPAIERVNEAGIPLALANTNANGGEAITFSAVENYDAMTQIAEYLVDALGGEGKVIVLEGTAGSQTAIDRLAAINDVFAANEGIEVLASQTADFNRAKGLEVMENLLQTYTEFDAVIACNDEMALGAIEALDAAGMLEGTFIAGFDGNNDAIQAVMDGRMTVTMFQNAPRQAGDAVQAIIDYINGEDVPDRIQTEALIIDASNVDDFASYLE